MSAPNLPAFALDTSESAWFDLWHTHVDWEGEGNASRESLHEFLAALFSVFERITEQLSGWSKPSNAWLLFVPGHSEDNSVHVHTANPNGTPFPYEFEGVSWGVPAPNELTDFMRPEYEVGVSRYNGEMYWVRVRNAT